MSFFNLVSPPISDIIYNMYYSNKLNSLKAIFDSDAVVLEPSCLVVENKRYPIIDDVIILSPHNKRSGWVKDKLKVKASGKDNIEYFAEDIQYTFGEEWKEYDKILDEHRNEFAQYFDLIDLKKINDLRVCDLGCGNGRWSYYLKELCREIVLVDFSDAIFTARKNLSGSDNCLFFMCDIKELPFKDDFSDLLFCLGVLHHLPTPCLDEVRNISRFSPMLLIYLYYSLDNRPRYFRFILGAVTSLRNVLSGIRNSLFRKYFSAFVALFIYAPFILFGKIMALFKLGRFVPLYEAYNGKSIGRIQQDVYDRFFTRIEQRVSRKEIEELRDTFSEVTISEKIPYWHFLCRR